MNNNEPNSNPFGDGDELTNAQRAEVKAIVAQALVTGMASFTDDIVQRVLVELSNQTNSESAAPAAALDDDGAAKIAKEWEADHETLEKLGVTKGGYFSSRAKDLGITTPTAHANDNAEQSKARREWASKPHLHAMGISEEQYVRQQC